MIKMKLAVEELERSRYGGVTYMNQAIAVSRALEAAQEKYSFNVDHIGLSHRVTNHIEILEDELNWIRSNIDFVMNISGARDDPNFMETLKAFELRTVECLATITPHHPLALKASTLLKDAYIRLDVIKKRSNEIAAKLIFEGGTLEDFLAEIEATLETITPQDKDDWEATHEIKALIAELDLRLTLG